MARTRFLVFLALVVHVCACGSPEREWRGIEPALTIELRPGETVSTVYRATVLDAVFVNHSDSPLTVIEPQDGSYRGWVPPHYDFRITDLRTGELLSRLPGCAHFHGSYTAETMHEVPPHGSVTLKAQPPRWIGEPGRYRYRLIYRMLRETYPGTEVDPGTYKRLELGKPWPEGVFVGEVSSSSVEIQVHAVTKAIVPHLARALRCEQTPREERNTILAILNKLGLDASEAVPALVRELNREPGYAHNVAETIGEIGSEAAEAVPALIDLLTRRKRGLWEQAIKTLGLIGPASEAAVPELIEVMAGDHGWSRRGAATALGQIARRADIVVPALLRYLKFADHPKKGNKSERRFAIRSLGQFGPAAREAVPVIERYLGSDGTGFQKTVNDPMSSLGDVAAEALKRIRGE